MPSTLPLEHTSYTVCSCDATKDAPASASHPMSLADSTATQSQDSAHCPFVNQQFGEDVHSPTDHSSSPLEHASCTVCSYKSIRCTGSCVASHIVGSFDRCAWVGSIATSSSKTLTSPSPTNSLGRTSARCPTVRPLPRPGTEGGTKRDDVRCVRILQVEGPRSHHASTEPRPAPVPALHRRAVVSLVCSAVARATITASAGIVQFDRLLSPEAGDGE